MDFGAIERRIGTRMEAPQSIGVGLGREGCPFPIGRGLFFFNFGISKCAF